MTHSAGTKKIRFHHLAAILTVFLLPLLLPYHARADNDGSVWTWGWNNCGQLGIGSDSDCASDFTRRNTPQPVSLNEVVAASGAETHTVVLRSDGTVWGWGRNEFGDLALGTTASPKNTPVQARNISGVIAVAAGIEFSLALKSDGTVWGWGSNTFGTLTQPFTGQDAVHSKTLPIQLRDLNNIVAIGAAGSSAAALRSDGTVWSWGMGSHGQLGDGSNVATYIPVMARNLTDVVAISVGYDHKVALKSDGALWAWGDRFICGTTSDSKVPVLIGGINDVVSIISGAFHAIAKKSDGTAWSWGIDSTYCVLGNAVCINKNTPTEVVAVRGAIAFSAGDYHSIALKPDGTVWSWGWNAAGQLGDGTDIDKKTAVMASGLYGVTTMGAGDSHTIAVKGRTSHSATLIDATHINIPVVNVLGNPMSARLEIVTPGDGNVLVRVSDLGYAFRNSSGSLIRVISNKTMLHIPSLIIESASFWVNLEYVPTTDGQIWFKLVSFGHN